RWPEGTGGSRQPLRRPSRDDAPSLRAPDERAACPAPAELLDDVAVDAHLEQEVGRDAPAATVRKARADVVFPARLRERTAPEGAGTCVVGDAGLERHVARQAAVELGQQRDAAATSGVGEVGAALGAHTSREAHRTSFAVPGAAAQR